MKASWLFFFPFFLVLLGAVLGGVFFTLRAHGCRGAVMVHARRRRPWFRLGFAVLLLLLTWPLGSYFSLSGDRARLSLHLNDDFKDWKDMGAVSPEVSGKAWVIDAAGSQPWCASSRDIEIRGRRPGPGGEIVGYSRKLEPEEEAARESARRSALEQLKALLLFEIKDLRGNGRRVSLVSAVPLVEEQVARQLNSLVLDRFDQRVDRPYGSLFRSALLVKADGKSLRFLRNEMAKALRDQDLERTDRRRASMSTAASALGLALIIFLLYSFLNASTKGHFAWPLRCLSLGALVVLYLGLIYLNGWFSA
jgi:hypothetical protein